MRAAEIDRARAEAEILLAHLLGVRRLDLLIGPERVLTPPEAAAYDYLVARRGARYPLPYLTGEREFMGLRFLVNEHVLIPRPETEILVEAAIDFLKFREASEDASLNPILIDVGTGSGAIALSLAHFVPEARVFATDLSAEACAVARENARRLEVAERVEVLAGDLLAPLEQRFGAVLPPAARASVICANLPYIPEENAADLQPEVRDWEPRLALLGGPGGLEIIKRLLAQLPDYLRPGGLLLLEIGPEAQQAHRLPALLEQDGRWQEIRVLPDLAGLPRVVAALFREQA